MCSVCGLTVRVYSNKINDYELKIHLVHEDMKKIYNDVVKNHRNIDTYHLTRRGHRVIYAINVCYLLGVISHDEAKEKTKTINNIISKEIENRN